MGKCKCCGDTIDHVLVMCGRCQVAYDAGRADELGDVLCPGCQRSADLERDAIIRMIEDRASILLAGIRRAEGRGLAMASGAWATAKAIGEMVTENRHRK